MNEIDNFEKKVLEHRKSLMYQAKKLTRNNEDAEDLVQETLLKAFKNKDKFDDKFIKAWLSRILTNTYIDKYRSKKGGIEDNYEDVPVSPDYVHANGGEITLEDKNVEDFVNQALADKPDLLELFNLFRQDYSYKEMCDITKKPMGTVKGHIHKARKILEKKIKRI